MGKIGPTRKRRSIAEFKEFLYEPGEGHYFHFCPVHANLLTRKQDIVEHSQGDVPLGPCNYPACKLKASAYFFPNLYTVLKRNK